MIGVHTLPPHDLPDLYLRSKAESEKVEIVVIGLQLGSDGNIRLLVEVRKVSFGGS